MFIAQNPWRYNAPPGWRDIGTAPRDGTPIEIQNNWGVAPHFAVCKWLDGDWTKANNPNSGMSDGPHLSWRPYNGDTAAYIDPTGGAQDTNAYWLHACGRPDLAIAAGNRKMDDPSPSPSIRPVAVAVANVERWWIGLGVTLFVIGMVLLAGFWTR